MPNRDISQPMERPRELPISDADWQCTPIAVQAVLVSLWDQVRKLQQVVEQQGKEHAARIAELEERLARRQGRGKGSPPFRGP